MKPTEPHPNLARAFSAAEQAFEQDLTFAAQTVQRAQRQRTRRLRTARLRQVLRYATGLSVSIVLAMVLATMLPLLQSSAALDAAAPWQQSALLSVGLLFVLLPLLGIGLQLADEA